MRLRLRGVASKIDTSLGKAEPYRTEGGKAARNSGLFSMKDDRHRLKFVTLIKYMMHSIYGPIEEARCYDLRAGSAQRCFRNSAGDA